MPTRVSPPSVPGPPQSLTLLGLQIALVAFLAYACARILLPFIGVLLWSAILAVLLYPLHLRLARRLGNRWSATLIGVVSVLLVLAPMVVMATSLATSASVVVTGLQTQTLTVPPPPLGLAKLPVIGERLTEAWALVSSNTPAALAKYGPSLRAPAKWAASAAGRMVAAELSFVLSFGIAAVLIAYGQGLAAFAQRLLHVVTGSAAQGVRLVSLSGATIRGVALGVLGVAAIQALLLGVGFFGIGLPAAGIVTLVVLLLGVVQVPATLVTLPVIIYVFATESLVPALIFSVWTLIMGLSDNVLKPLMLGRGLEAPMPVILLGVIGGMIVDGLLGLFVGPVLLAIAYVLFKDWLQQQPVEGGGTAGESGRVMVLAVGILTGLVCLVFQCATYLPAARYFSWATARAPSDQRLRTVFLQFSVLMVLLMLGNVLQITIWAALYRTLGAFEDWQTALYFSGVTFTTLGYGDVVLEGRVRLLAPLQAANGLMMFGISTAAFIAAFQQVMARWTRDHPH